MRDHRSRCTAELEGESLTGVTRASFAPSGSRCTGDAGGRSPLAVTCRSMNSSEFIVRVAGPLEHLAGSCTLGRDRHRVFEALHHEPSGSKSRPPRTFERRLFFGSSKYPQLDQAVALVPATGFEPVTP